MKILKKSEETSNLENSRIEQSYLEARIATFESTLTGPNYRVGNFRFLKNHKNLIFLKIFEKITKNVVSRKLQRIEQKKLGGKIQNLCEYSDRTQLQGWEFQILRKKLM